jgi:hypothetical protein
MRLILPLLLLASSVAWGQAKSETEFVAKIFYPATALLYAQDDNGTMKMRCTATSIEKTAKGYVFVTAAHCGCEDNTENKTVSPEKAFFFITADDNREKRFLVANPIVCGYRHTGDDFFLLQVDTDLVFPVVPLGEDPVVMEPIVNVASPLGIGKQVFQGSVSSASLDRPVLADDINWTHASLLQLFGTDGGSSGSAVVCLNQKKICSFVVGSIDKTTIVAMPVSRLLRLRELFSKGEYTHWKADPDEVPDKKVKKSSLNDSLVLEFSRGDYIDHEAPAMTTLKGATIAILFWSIVWATMGFVLGKHMSK